MKRMTPETATRQKKARFKKDSQFSMLSPAPSLNARIRSGCLDSSSQTMPLSAPFFAKTASIAVPKNPNARSARQ